MSASTASKYRPLSTVDLPDRQWPNRTLTSTPLWCSVDLRDGNQALAQPMSVEEKLEYFDMLVRIGFKQIEVGFPSASQTEFDFCRRLIDENRIPSDVSIQILCQCREDLIVRSCAALAGAPNVVFHLYNSTSPAQRKYVFGADRSTIAKIATDAVALLKQHGAPLISAGMNMQLEYSPESFTSTEMDFALEICERVTDVWQPTTDNKIILNLPATVEYTTPNVHADQIEWMCRHLTRRELTVVSLHTHNDRGTGIAATELGLLAGADSVEGTLFGNGERTGNLDIVTVALNLHTHGIESGLNFSELNDIREIYERTTRMEVPPRSPYAGDLVFTAFSGSHQDAIKKSWDQQTPGHPWDVLYIPIDPADIGRNYKAIIRINSQSGKGGVAYILETEYGFILPKAMHREFGPVINQLADAKGTELSAPDILTAFQTEYLDRTTPIEVLDFRTTEKNRTVSCEADVSINGETRTLTGQGNGPIAAYVTAVREAGLLQFEFLNYTEHSLGTGARAQAVSYIQIHPAAGQPLYGTGIDTSIDFASIKAVTSAINRSLARSLVDPRLPMGSWTTRL
ncbi:MAG: 2-isopropylmalate synthase [Candidatus Synoicihabitans palmerolidicus]|nr:2-isopropylmalate synthase [Candidatus Synoicihabitans palmerolidicus]